MFQPNEARRNFRLGVVNGLFFVLGETLIEPTLVIAAFVNAITHSALWVGFAAATLEYAWFLPQFWVSGYLQSQPRKMPFYKLSAVIRAAAWVTLTLAIFFIHERSWLAVVFLLALSVAALGGGLSGLSFLEIVGKTIPPAERGQFFAWRLTIAGIVGVGASVVVQRLLSNTSPVSFPNNYGALFLLATLLFFCGWWAFFRVNEPPDSAVLPRASLSQQLRRAFQIIRTDSRYRHFFALRSALIIGGAAVPFYAIYSQQTWGGAPAMIGVYLAAFKAANLLGNIYLGRVSARWGYHRLMQVAAVTGLLMSLMVGGLVWGAAAQQLPGWIAAWGLAPVFVVNGIRESGIGVAGQSLLLEIAPQTDRSLYLGFTNTFLGLIVLAASFSGAVVEYLGFPSLLVITLIAGGAALNSALRLRGRQPSVPV